MRWIAADEVHRALLAPRVVCLSDAVGAMSFPEQSGGKQEQQQSEERNYTPFPRLKEGDPYRCDWARWQRREAHASACMQPCMHACMRARAPQAAGPDQGRII